MIPISTRNRLRRSRRALLLGVLVAGQILCVAHAADASDAKAFTGDWKYKQTCGYQHSATVTLTQTGENVTGDWTDGTRLSGSDGSLKGSIRNGKLYVRYCGGDEHAGYAVCPSYETEESDYFARQGSDLVWYRKVGKKEESTYEKYVVLHPVIKGKHLPVDDHCTDDKN
ncbi:hypothetical protein [Rhodanobacter sp. C01]|uniref:hypothetical protein n=1 Tax=Rhodanobacter sp. C01 TaxID=1945856 RepID=UPI0011155A03|nr:hypothetical protein [Rhodanobacter sp. C01]